ncbi:MULTISPECIES: hypothetical protein [Cyanophyceae]|uniref:hypothetical protein n=1 Tax=Cyanophyceae TaxID=3028117 RepID=UPI0018F054BE|nr:MULTISPECIES: hypothetical protein [Cyanophyceae]
MTTKTFGRATQRVGLRCSKCPKRVCTICGPSIPEWSDRFGLRQGTLPPINTALARPTLRRIGQQVAIQFQRYEVPFSPYDLRHAWAVRTIHFGLPDTVAARIMGHSVAIHNRTYHRWITHRDQRAAVQAALQRGTWQPPL